MAGYQQQNANTLLKTLGKTGVPATRISTVSEANQLCAKLIEADKLRSNARALIEGAVNGNPPYRKSDLVRSGQASRCNVNFRLAEAFLEQAEGAFYDLFSESPTYSTIRYKGSDDPSQDETFSQIISEEFDIYNKADRDLDELFQLSIREMILFGAGPVMWSDELSPSATPLKYKMLKLPSDVRANVEKWNVAVIVSEYTPDELYAFIRNEKAAVAAGWNIPETRKAIMAAAPVSERKQSSWNWEWMQQRLNQNDLYYSVAGDAIIVCHIFYREFPRKGSVDGKISHKITMENQSNQESFLFDKVDRFDNWRQFMAPFYQDRGDGYHYGVKGMGVKMYGALEIFNRLHCATLDAGFDALTNMFQTETDADEEKMAVVQMGPRTWLKSGVKIVENNLGQRIDGPMAVKRDLQELLTANLSTYRQGMKSKEGNPITAREAEILAANQASLGKTQINRYYVQLDEFWTERFRRSSNPSIPEDICGGAAAKEFQKRCIDRGVPKNFRDKVQSVRATRAMGQGSAFLRLQSLDKMLGGIALLPASGQENLIRDWLAANAGQSNSLRYYPERDQRDKPTEEQAEAMQDVGLLKQGIMPVIVDTDDHIIRAQTALEAAAKAAQSLQQGADPMSVLGFIEACGPYIATHLQQVSNNPAKQAAVKQLTEQWKQLAAFADDLKKHVQQQSQEKQAQQEQHMAALQQIQNVQGGTDPETQLKWTKTMADIQMKQMKTKASIADKDRKTAQSIELKNATTANNIALQRRQAAEKANGAATK